MRVEREVLRRNGFNVSDHSEPCRSPKPYVRWLRAAMLTYAPLKPSWPSARDVSSRLAKFLGVQGKERGKSDCRRSRLRTRFRRKITCPD